MYPTKRVQRSYLPMLWKKLALFGFKSDEQTLTSFVVEAFLFRWTQNISRDPCEEWTYFNMSCQWVTLQKLFSKIFVSRLVIGKYQDFVLGQTLKPPLSLSLPGSGEIQCLQRKKNVRWVTNQNKDTAWHRQPPTTQGTWQAHLNTWMWRCKILYVMVLWLVSALARAWLRS